MSGTSGGAAVPVGRAGSGSGARGWPRRACPALGVVGWDAALLAPLEFSCGVVLTPGGTSPRDLLLVFCPAAPKFSYCEPVRLLRFDSSQGPGAAVRLKSSK